MEIEIVRRGESLSAVARRCGCDAPTLARLNQLGDSCRLAPNQALLVPGPSRPRREILINAYACPGLAASVLAETLPGLSALCPFARRITAAGELLPLPDGALAGAARASGAAPFLTVSNLNAAGAFSSDLVHSLLHDDAARTRLSEALLGETEAGGWSGVNLHFAYLYPFDREDYTRLLQRLAEQLHGCGRYLSVALPPREGGEAAGSPDAAFDYAAIGALADFTVLLSYDWGYACSAPQAVSPIDRVRRALDRAVGQIPPEKLLLGLSNYGYRWFLPWRRGDAAAVISGAAAADLAASTGASIRFSERAQAPWFCCSGPDGSRSVVWFEDVRSLYARMELVWQYALGGISWWSADRLLRPALALAGDLFEPLSLPRPD